jgi:hypothetical protein
MINQSIRRPETGEYAPYYAGYVSLAWIPTLGKRANTTGIIQIENAEFCHPTTE